MPEKENEEVLGALAALSQAVGAGFEDVRGELKKVRGDIADVRQDIQRLEAYILQDHERRLEKIEDKLGMR